MSNPTKRSSKKSPTYSPEIDDIPEDEKMRLIKETGIFKTLKQAETDRQEQSLAEADPYSYGPTFQAFIYTIPLCSVYAVMDILVHRQYNEEVSFFPFSTRVLKVAPSKSVVYLIIPGFFINNPSFSNSFMVFCLLYK